ncbi:hypothetical protein VDG19_20585, partial [Xanthomonas campestris pv. raphani]|nr:hypothetical protein [Xanthomonas campestris pv. raphani]
REGGASVPGDQAPVRLHQGPLSRPGQEPRAGADAVCAVKPVDEAKAVDACRRDGVPVTRATPCKRAGNGKKIEDLSAVSLADVVRLILRRR